MHIKYRIGEVAKSTLRHLRDTKETRIKPKPAPGLARKELPSLCKRTADVAAMHDGLSCRELAETLVGGALGRVLAKLGASIDRQVEQQAECESQKGPEPLSDSICSRESGVGLVGRHVTPDGGRC